MSKEQKQLDISKLGVAEVSCMISSLGSLSYSATKNAAELLPSMYLAFSEGLLVGERSSPDAFDGDKLTELGAKYSSSLTDQDRIKFTHIYNNACGGVRKKIAGDKDIAKTLLLFPALARDVEMSAMLGQKDLSHESREFLEHLVAFEALGNTLITSSTTGAYLASRKLGEKIHGLLKDQGIIKEGFFKDSFEQLCCINI
jgi:hypothetical protein